MNDINHSGVLGMKWGRRKVPNSSDHDEAARLRKIKTKRLSNAELEKVLKRADLETRMKRIKPDHVTEGTKKVNAIMETIGKVTKGTAAAIALYKIGKSGYNYLLKNKKAASVVTSVVSKVTNVPDYTI